MTLRRWLYIFVGLAGFFSGPHLASTVGLADPLFLVPTETGAAEDQTLTSCEPRPFADIEIQSEGETKLKTKFTPSELTTQHPPRTPSVFWEEAFGLIFRFVINTPSRGPPKLGGRFA